MMPITMANIGENVQIQRISGTDEAKSHLSALGFVTGETVNIVSKNGGNMIVSIKDSRIALDQSMANRIFI